LNTSRFRRIPLIIFLTALCSSAAVGIWIFLFGEFGITEVDILLTTIALTYYSLAGLSSMAVRKVGKIQTYFSNLCLIFYTLAFIYTVVVIWGFMDTDLLEVQYILVLKTVAFSLAQISLILLIQPSKKFIKILKFVTVVFIAVVTTLLSRFFLNDFEFSKELTYRLLGVLAIIDVLGTLTTPVLNSWFKRYQK